MTLFSMSNNTSKWCADATLGAEP